MSAIVQLNIVFYFYLFHFYMYRDRCENLVSSWACVSVCLFGVCVCVQGPDLKGISSYSSQSHSSENPV